MPHDKDEPAAACAGRETELEMRVRSPIRFSFRCRGRKFAAEVVSGPATAVVHVVTDAGYIPYSAESRSLRRTLLKALTTRKSGVHITADQRIVMRSEMAVDLPVRPERVVATAAALALASAAELARISDLCEELAEPA